MFTPFRICVGLLAAYLAAKGLWNGYYVLSLAPALLALWVFEPIYLHIRATAPQAPAEEEAPSQPPRSPRCSRVASEYIETTMDLGTSTISGRVLKGRFAARRLDDLSLNELLALAEELAVIDETGSRLLESFLNAAHPNWREAAERRQASADSAPMTRKRALALLGLTEGATNVEITTAWKAALKRNHPDLGGADAIAALLNEAKEILLA